MKKAFTLAEVLIVLAIIGVISALTIPTLISKYNRQVITTRLKKTYSMFSQAVQLSTVDNGNSSTWDSPKKLWDANAANEYFAKYIEPYLKISKKCIGVTDESCNPEGYSSVYWGLYSVQFITGDGTYCSLFPINAEQIRFTCDVNGNNKPNEEGKDIFAFDLNTPKGNLKAIIDIPSPRESIKQNCLTSTYDRPTYCFALFQYDGYKFSDDYPYNF